MLSGVIPVDRLPAPSFKFVVVDKLPDNPDSNYIYNVKGSDDLYCYADGEFAKLCYAEPEYEYNRPVRMVRCEYCGTKMPEDASHCKSCGAPL